MISEKEDLEVEDAPAANGDNFECLISAENETSTLMSLNQRTLSFPNESGPAKIDVEMDTENDVQENTIIEGMDTEELTDDQPVKLIRLPISRLKTIIKTVPSVHLVNSEAVALLSFATEKFIADFSREAMRLAAELGKKTLSKPHLERIIRLLPEFEFLDGMLDW